eukprot:TRINITY_DN7970_c1_g1_i1.p1 TRINITY_DN7970_c1_g1~~TRINITY_DN7970_c1_g1_i1.p1  ORF type:complete len:347 (-),score=-38.24 TRINITY_DN7970_c1_g1_i1:38-1078(-)
MQIITQQKISTAGYSQKHFQRNQSNIFNLQIQFQTLFYYNLKCVKNLYRKYIITSIFIILYMKFICHAQRVLHVPKFTTNQTNLQVKNNKFVTVTIQYMHYLQYTCIMYIYILLQFKNYNNNMYITQYVSNILHTNKIYSIYLLRSTCINNQQQQQTILQTTYTICMHVILIIYVYACMLYTIICIYACMLYTQAYAYVYKQYVYKKKMYIFAGQQQIFLNLVKQDMYKIKNIFITQNTKKSPKKKQYPTKIIVIKKKPTTTNPINNTENKSNLTQINVNNPTNKRLHFFQRINYYNQRCKQQIVTIVIIQKTYIYQNVTYMHNKRLVYMRQIITIITTKLTIQRR